MSNIDIDIDINIEFMRSIVQCTKKNKDVCNISGQDILSICKSIIKKKAFNRVQYYEKKLKAIDNMEKQGRIEYIETMYPKNEDIVDIDYIPMSQRPDISEYFIGESKNRVLVLFNDPTSENDNFIYMYKPEIDRSNYIVKSAKIDGYNFMGMGDGHFRCYTVYKI